MSDKKERKLTKREQRRKEKFIEKCHLMEKDGYKVENLFFSILLVNILGILVILPINFLFLAVYYLFNDYTPIDNTYSPFIGLIYIGLLLLLIVVHELIHGTTWGYFAAEGRKSIDFGIIWQALTPYCTCSSPLTKREYIWGALMPTIVLGLIPGFIAAITGWLPLLIMSQLMILAGAGDVLVVARLLLHRPKNAKVVYLDHPTECGLVAFVKNNYQK